MMDIYDGAPWTEMDVEDLKAAIEAGHSRIHRDKRPAYRTGSPARVLTVRPSARG